MSTRCAEQVALRWEWHCCFFIFANWRNNSVFSKRYLLSVNALCSAGSAAPNTVVSSICKNKILNIFAYLRNNSIGPIATCCVNALCSAGSAAPNTVVSSICKNKILKSYLLRILGNQQWSFVRSATCWAQHVVSSIGKNKILNMRKCHLSQKLLGQSLPAVSTRWQSVDWPCVSNPLLFLQFAKIRF